MSAKFTPGPWQAKDRIVECAAGDVAIAMLNLAADVNTSEANARLIAAAPELYEALRKAVAHIALLNDTLEQLAELGATIAICGADYDDVGARAALAKVDAP